MEVQEVFRCGVGKVQQLFFKHRPVGGMQVPEQLYDTAKTAAELQRMADDRLGKRTKERRLGMLIHTYAHVLVSHFTKHVKIPFEYKRKSTNFFTSRRLNCNTILVLAMIRMVVSATDTIPQLVKEQPEPWGFCLKRAIAAYQEELSQFRPVSY